MAFLPITVETGHCPEHPLPSRRLCAIHLLLPGQSTSGGIETGHNNDDYTAQSRNHSL